jgi:hypothetical protein
MAKRYTDFPNGIKSWPRDDQSVVQTATDTLTAAECTAGKTIYVDAASAITLTLPILTGVIGGLVTIVNLNEGQALTIDPNAADGIALFGNVTDGKTIVNTAATAKKGDYVTLSTGWGGATGATATYWIVVAMQGIWADGAQMVVR